MVLRYILHSLLKNAAKEKVRETVVEAAQEHLRQNTGQRRTGRGEPSSHDMTCDVGVVFAMAIESGELEDRLDEKATSTFGQGFAVRTGTLGEHRVGIVRGGVGREKAAAATEAFITGHKPRLVISAGLAGGLKAEMKRSDILMANRLVDVSGAILSVDLRVDAASLAAVPGVYVGNLLTADRIIRSPSDKRAMGEKYGALAVDMETFAVGEVCRRHKVPFLAVRAISDTVNDALPEDVDKLLAQKTTTGKIGAAVGAIWRRPGSVKDMVQLRENAIDASARLAKFLVAMIGQLPQ